MNLTKEEILENIKKEKIKIEPFDEELLKEESYEVRLGKFYYKYKNPEYFSSNMMNPYSAGIESNWDGPFISKPLTKRFKFENISENDEIISLDPDETILVHTLEYVGGDCFGFKVKKLKEFNFLSIKVRSNQDFSRITLIIKNKSKLSMLLVVNRPIANIFFYQNKIKRNIETQKLWNCHDMINLSFLNKTIL